MTRAISGPSGGSASYLTGMQEGRGTSRRQPRLTGYVQTLKSGSLRVRVYAGVDVLTGHRNYLSEVVPAGPKAAELAEATRARLVNLVVEDRQPKTNASLSQLLRTHLDFVDIEPRGRHSLECYIGKHIDPRIGKRSINSLKTFDFEWFYVELRRCRDHCDGTPTIRHRVKGPHRCTSKCRPHKCRPLGAATIRKIHFLMNAAFTNAVVWEWIGENPVAGARKPGSPPPRPNPPTADEAASLLNEAWRHGYGPFVWLAMTTGARRGELCALRWRALVARHTTAGEHDCAASKCQWTLEIRKSLGCHAREVWETDTKTHQIRKIALDLETVAVLLTLREQAQRDSVSAGCTLSEDCYMFAAGPDGVTPINPPSITQRYARWAKRLGIKTTLKALRHYSATELIIGGVDVRTVAGRLGHGGGGTTTLKVYTAWVSEADQRASATLMNAMPSRPAAPLHSSRDTRGQESPYLEIAESLTRRIAAGDLPLGHPIPTVKELAAAFQVSVGTAHRAVSILVEDALVSASRGKRALVIAVPAVAAEPAEVTGTEEPAATGGPIAATKDTGEDVGEGKRWLVAETIHFGTTVRSIRAHVDPRDCDALLKLLRTSLRHLSVPDTRLDEYELAVRSLADAELITTVAAA